MHRQRTYGVGRGLAKLVIAMMLAAAYSIGAYAQQGQNNPGSDPVSQFINGFTQAMKNGIGGGIGSPRTHPMLEQVGLAKIMPQYDDRQPLSIQFPHVALTVHHAPPSWAGPAMQNNRFTGGFSNIAGCWTLTAVVWYSETQSRNVGPFDWCGPQDVQITPGPLAGMGMLKMQDVYYSTGMQRTNGPRPPQTILPEDRRDFGSGRPAPNLSQFTGSGIWLMYANVLYAMGSTPGRWGDYRIWVVTVED